MAAIIVVQLVAQCGKVMPFVAEFFGQLHLLHVESMELSQVGQAIIMILSPNNSVEGVILMRVSIRVMPSAVSHEYCLDDMLGASLGGCQIKQTANGGEVFVKDAVISRASYKIAWKFWFIGDIT